MNLYEVVNSVESDWAILYLGPGYLSFEEDGVCEYEEEVNICSEKLCFSIPKSVKFVLSEESKYFIRFKVVGHEGTLLLYKKK